MTAKNNLNDAINDCIAEANTAWGQIRNKFLGDEDVDVKLRLKIAGSLASSEIVQAISRSA